jgi:hypothetical protein
MKVLLHSILLLALLACNASKTQNTSTGAINASAPYKWTATFPRTMAVSQDFDANEHTAIQLMSTAWKSSVSNTVTWISYGADTSEVALTNLDALYDGVMGIYKSAHWPSNLPGSALAVTQIFGRRYNTGSSTEFVNIEHADILVNYDFYTFDTVDAGPGYDLRTVVLHEMGHFLGLQHKASSSNSTLSIMYPSIGSTEAKRAPKSLDISDISSKYGIASSSANPAAMAQRVKYEIKSGDVGEPVKIIYELHADGKCVHTFKVLP